MGNSPCPPEVRRGRQRKAVDFLASATALGIVVDTPAGLESYVQLCILAGVAAADVICCAKLGHHSQGEDHNAAASLLNSVDGPSAKNLRVLLGMKTRSGYGHSASATNDKKRAGRAATALVEEAMQY